MLRNTDSSYGWAAIALHWLMALAVFGLFGLGLYMVDLTYYDPWYRDSLALHKSIGLLLAGVWLLRVLWRLLNPTPKDLSGSRLQALGAHAAHALLYAMMLALFVSGYLISTADGRAIEVFNWFSIPATLTGDNQEDLAGMVHEWLAWGLIALVALHALAALKHHFVNRDATLKRMITVIKQEQTL
jgi:cytochrome b561